MYNRILALFPVVVLLMSLVGDGTTYAGGIGGCEPDCPPFISICKGGPHAGLECTNDADCPESLCIQSTLTQQPPWERKCKGGASDGQMCSTTSACGTGFCEIQFVNTTPPFLKATLTIIVDDDEGRPNHEPACKAAAMIFELKKGGKPYFLSQLYRCLPEDLETDAEFLQTEAGLTDSASAAPSAPPDPSGSTTVSILDRLLFRPTDLDLNELSIGQVATQVVGGGFVKFPAGVNLALLRPAIVSAKKVAKTFANDDHTADGLASVVRFEVQVRFVTIDDDLLLRRQ